MSIPPSASSANSSSNTDKTAIRDAANQAFIDGATVAINQAISQGKFTIYINSTPRMSRNYIQTYFEGLGYNIAIPYYDNGMDQPGGLFGSFWNGYWVNEDFLTLYSPYSFLPNYYPDQPYQVMISWYQA